MAVTFILGGARSGKSQRAEALAEAMGLPVIYVATAPKIVGDEEWTTRISHHQQRRNNDWKTIEEELALVDVISTQAKVGVVLVVDCLTLWLSNLMYHGRDMAFEVKLLCEMLTQLEGDVIVVANEVGMGLVPETSDGRVFRDAQGRLNQAVVAVADTAEFVVAGLPMRLKGEGK